MELDRRRFLKGAAAAGVAAAGMGLAACASGSGSTGTTSDGANGPESGSSDVLTYEVTEKQWSFEIAPEAITDDQITDTFTADIIVVGSGMAGLCTAVAAKEAGADVLVVSAGSASISRGGSNHSIGTKVQKDFGITYSPEEAREIAKVEQTSGTYWMDKQKWANWINNSGETMDWVIEKMTNKGLKVSIEPGYFDPDGVLTVPDASHNFFTDEQPFGALFGAPLQAQAYADTFTDDLGGTIYYNTPVKQLTRGGIPNGTEGAVDGCIAQDADGNYIKFVANKAVVLATGDFSRDRDMMARYSPWAYEHFKDVINWEDVDYDVGLNYDGLMHGDGHKMALWVGAAWQKTFPNAPMINGGCAGPSHAVISNFWGLNMNIYGKRYQNENTNFAYGAMAVEHLPKRTAFGVWDINYAKTQDSWDYFGCCRDNVNGFVPYTPEEYVAAWDEAVKSGRYFKADTIEELVDILVENGLEDKEAALETIANYDAYAKAGYDEEFQVNPSILYPIDTPPFYGSKTVSSTFLTVTGGIRTNSDMQALDADDNPIEGLYTTGIMVGDFYANSYNFVMPGQNLGGICGTLSVLLGRHLAEL